MLITPGLVAASLLLAPQATSDDVESVTVLTLGRVESIEGATVTAGHLWVPEDATAQVNGFHLKPEGLCAAEICIPLPADGSWTRERDGVRLVDVSAFAERVGQPVATTPAADAWSFGPVPALRAPLLTGQAPEFELRDREGHVVRLSDFRGKRVLLLTWASW